MPSTGRRRVILSIREKKCLTLPRIWDSKESSQSTSTAPTNRAVARGRGSRSNGANARNLSSEDTAKAQAHELARLGHYYWGTTKTTNRASRNWYMRAVLGQASLATCSDSF